jgi:succinyl-CoA synthetase beta subunit
VVVVGAGGIYVELFGDATCALPPFDVEVAESMLRRLRIWTVLEGARGGERADVDSLASAVARFSELVSDMAGSLVSLEINPLVVRPGTGGVLALDAVMELAGEGVTA